MKAQGILKHHFWGTYCATLILGFENEEACDKALPLLAVGELGTYRNACGGICQSTFQKSEAEPRAAMITASGETLEKLIDKLVSFGAERRAISSMAKSIDRGEVFRFEVKE